MVSEPSWPVFMACNMSNASSARTSPTTMRSGRIRKLLITSCRCRTAPLPSMLGARVSRRTTCSCFICNSAASSMVTMRSVAGIYPESTFNKVVLPAPVPPEIKIFSLPFTMEDNNSSMGSVRVLFSIILRAVRGSRPNRRIERQGPSMAKGGMMAFTREPSARRASTIGDDSSTRRPTLDTMRSMICIRWESSLKLKPVSSSLPLRSM